MGVESSLGLRFIGFGNVGQGLARILVRKERELAERWGLSCRAVAVVTRTRGAAVSRGGLPLEELLARVDRGEPIGPDRITPVEASLLPQTDIVLDVTPTNLKTGEPGLSVTRAALASDASPSRRDEGAATMPVENLCHGVK